MGRDTRKKSCFKTHEEIAETNVALGNKARWWSVSRRLSGRQRRREDREDGGRSGGTVRRKVLGRIRGKERSETRGQGEGSEIQGMERTM